jgi:hypothetical protein
MGSMIRLAFTKQDRLSFNHEEKLRSLSVDWENFSIDYFGGSSGNIFGYITTHLNCTECLFMYRDSIFSNSYNVDTFVIWFL